MGFKWTGIVGIRVNRWFDSLTGKLLTIDTRCQQDINTHCYGC